MRQGFSPRVLLLSSYDPGSEGSDEGTDFGERIYYTMFILTMAVAFWATVAVKFVKENRISVLNNPTGKENSKHTLKHSRCVKLGWPINQ